MGRSLHFHIDLPQLELLPSGLGLLYLEMVISALLPLGLVLMTLSHTTELGRNLPFSGSVVPFNGALVPAISSKC